MSANAHVANRSRHDARTAATPRTRTTTVDFDDAPVVHWPDPSPLQPWWNALMGSAHHPD